MDRLTRSILFGRLLGAILLLFTFYLAISSIQDKSPTFDEQGFLTRGLAYLRDANRQLRVGHPLGLNALNALFLAPDKQVELPVAELEKKETDFHRPSEMFMWEIGNDVRRIMVLGRLPTIWLGLLMIAAVGRWAWLLTGRRLVGLMALFLIAFDPNILAHMRLATTDLGLAAAALFAGMTLWFFLKEPGWQRAILVGVTFGLLQNTKFTAGLFVPLFGLVILIAFIVRWRQSTSRTITWSSMLMLLVAYSLVAFVTLWAANGFQVGTLPENLPILPQLSGLTLPLSHYLEQLLDIGGRMQKTTPSFLLGQYSNDGWWYYFPVAFFLKTSLPVLLLFAWAFWRLTRCAASHLPTESCPLLLDISALLIPSVGFFLIALTTDINLGYRHLLPILPFLYVFTAIMLPKNSMINILPGERLIKSRWVAYGLMAWIVAISILVYPHYLAFFNILAGGPNGGWRYLVDSNIDWGQDLEALNSWIEENEVGSVWLSYFGEARPTYYGINYTGLDSYPPRLMNPEAQPFYPHYPAPGTYAISVTNLQGVHFDDHDRFSWFRDREPIDKIGYSIFVYEVPKQGVRADLVLGGIQPHQIAPEDYRFLGTNDVEFRWVDTEQAIIVPENFPWWLASSRHMNIDHNFEPIFRMGEPIAANNDYQLFRFDTNVEQQQSIAVFEKGSDSIKLVEVTLPELRLHSGNALTFETRWLKHGQPKPVKIFIHITDDQDNIVMQWDGLGIAWEGWRDGDLLWQIHSIPIPDDLRAGSYHIYTGLYNPVTGQRWQSDSADRYYLGHLDVG